MKDLTALIVAHTGKGPKAKNDKEGAFKAEAPACVGSPVLIRTPPPSPPSALAPAAAAQWADFEDDGLGAEEDDDEYM